jgi:hypothetical protein
MSTKAVSIGAEAEKDEDFKIIPGGLLLTFPIEHAAEALDVLRDRLNSFVEMAMARVRQRGAESRVCWPAWPPLGHVIPKNSWRYGISATDKRLSYQAICAVSMMSA